MKKSKLLLGITLITLSLAGCGKDEIKPTETQPPVQAIQPTESTIKETEPIKETGTALEIAEFDGYTMIEVDPNTGEIASNLYSNTKLQHNDTDEESKESLSSIQDPESNDIGRYNNGEITVETGEIITETEGIINEHKAEVIINDDATVPDTANDEITGEELMKMQQNLREYTYELSKQRMGD